jgi:hypothetical protein
MGSAWRQTERLTDRLTDWLTDRPTDRPFQSNVQPNSTLNIRIFCRKVNSVIVYITGDTSVHEFGAT